MRVRLRVLLLSWISLLNPAEHVPAGASLFQPETSTRNWPFNPETFQSKWVETDSKSDTAAPVGNDLVSWEESSEQRAAHAIVERDEGAPEGSRPGTVGRPFRLLGSFKGLGVSLALLLCVSLLSASLMRRPRPKEQEEYDRKREARARLEKVKDLFPAAKKLALVVDSAESHALLGKIGDILTENHLAPPETTKVERFETFLADALKALRRLHQAAIEEARVVVQADESLPEFSTLGLSPEPSTYVLFAFEQNAEPHTLRPLVRTYRSLFDSFTGLTKQFKDSAKRLFSQRPFEDEKDADVLVKTAASFEALRATGTSRRRLSEVGGEVGKNVIEGVKLMLLGRRNQVLRQMEGDLQMLRLRCSLAKNAEDAGADTAAAGTLTAVKKQELLGALERDAEEAEALLAQVRSHVEALQTSTTLAAATAAKKSCLEAEERAGELLEQCSRTEALLPELPEHVDAATSALLHDMAKNNVGIARTQSTSLLESLERIRTTAERKGRWLFLPDSSAQSIVRNLMQQARETGAQGRQRAEQCAAVVENLDRAKDTRRAVDMLATSSANLVMQTVDSWRLLTLESCFHLLAFLEDDMDYTDNQAGKAVSQSFSLSGQEKQKYEQSQEMYAAAKRAAAGAGHPLEAAEAAAEMRERVFEMQSLFFVPSGEEN